MSALFVITEDKTYHTDMLAKIEKYNTETNKQEKNQKQKENRMTSEEIQTIYDNLETKTKPLFKKKN